MRALTIVMAYYQNQGMLAKHLRTWSEYPAELRKKISAIIVDDGSPDEPAEPVCRSIDAGVPLQLFRIKQDKPWNQNGARNLGMKHAEGWCLLTDMDHLLTAKNAVRLFELHVKAKRFYVPGRHKAIGTPYHAHPNSYVIHADTYWAAGGYDEDFCGWYGSDSVFRRMLMQVAAKVEIPKVSLELYGREVIPDASTRTLGRKGSEYHSSNNPDLVKKRRGDPVKATNHLRFEWERVI